jgi:hypothetical protein
MARRTPSGVLACAATCRPALCAASTAAAISLCVNVGRPGGDNAVAIDQHLPADVNRFAIENRRRF